MVPQDSQNNTATWEDYEDLTFWIWACLRTANSCLEAYKRASEPDFRMATQTSNLVSKPLDNQNLKMREAQLANYNFVTTMGVLIRVLKRAQNIFPSIQSSFSRASHLNTEGTKIRNMIEHAYGKDGYLTGNGLHQKEFNRAKDNIESDALGVIVKTDGHWLGNRLCVEIIINEVKNIQKSANMLTPPK